MTNYDDDMSFLDDDSNAVVDDFKSLVSNSLDGKVEDCVLDAKTGFFVTPMKARLITLGKVQGLPVNMGELTLAQITTGEIEVLVKDYLKDVKRRRDNEEVFEYACSGTYRAQVLADMRIDAFLEAGAISKERVGELSDSIFGESN